ncbi:conserved hypothetical protein [Brucella ovis ATCC 25840]|uniref:Uncharacterized protein n=1 Tax=Brucella ovis (strain ATCC 25840 / 63/290 / NCTC 10512) TaxID=444178 RepID=A0A0H3AQU8_BRUO2|nr:conserved hypothetical protein [Brucella ovis ATCC 25840]
MSHYPAQNRFTLLLEMLYILEKQNFVPCFLRSSI